MAILNTRSIFSSLQYQINIDIRHLRKPDNIFHWRMTNVQRVDDKTMRISTSARSLPRHTLIPDPNEQNPVLKVGLIADTTGFLLLNPSGFDRSHLRG